MITRIAINQYVSGWSVRQETEGGFARHFAERATYAQACVLAAQWCKDHHFTTYTVWRFTTRYTSLVSVIEANTGAVRIAHPVYCG